MSISAILIGLGGFTIHPNDIMGGGPSAAHHSAPAP
jgi:hypothetical protein